MINLDREAGRWRRQKAELNRFRTKDGERLGRICRRFSAVDARYLSAPVSRAEVLPHYSAADQLYVDPAPVSATLPELRDLEILLTPQETAIALSHLGVWRRFLETDHHYALVLEDDVAFHRGFVRRVERAWYEMRELTEERDCLFDVLYLSYDEVRQGAEKEWLSDSIFRPIRGLWQLSGYVISRRGAERLVEGLPIRGPVDLWMNLRMADLNVLALPDPPVAQRIDSPSSNAYSSSHLGATWDRLGRGCVGLSGKPT